MPQNVQIRVPDDRQVQLALIDSAAAAAGETRSQFMFQAAVAAAERSLLDRTLFLVDADRFEAFAKALDTPLPDATKKLLARPSPWEK